MIIKGDCFTEGTRDFFVCQNFTSREREVLTYKKSQVVKQS